MRLISCSFILLSLLLFCGCTSAPPGTKISGSVTLDGKPLDDGSISFVDPKGNSQGFGIKGGKYTAYLTPGEKEVFFYAVKVVREIPRNEFPGDTEIIQEFESILPKKYTQPGHFTFTVGEKSDSKDFALTSGD